MDSSNLICSVGYGRRSRALTLEMCRKVVSYTESQGDLSRLCQVSQSFRVFAERALYNTLQMRDIPKTLLLCRTLSSTPRISAFVDALTLYTMDEEVASENSSNSEKGSDSVQEFPHNFWGCIAHALEKMINLQYLSIHIADSANANVAWMLSKCTFQLRSFHCDLSWDNHLISFLNRQTNLIDLYILDFLDTKNLDAATITEKNAASLPHSLSSAAFPHLSTLECTFAEAAMAITPGRPLMCLKTCFSRTQLDEKRAEMAQFLTRICRSTRPLRALDIADSRYTTVFSMELLTSIVASRVTSLELRYLGTLVLPISGRQVSGDCCYHLPKLLTWLTPWLHSVCNFMDSWCDFPGYSVSKSKFRTGFQPLLPHRRSAHWQVKWDSIHPRFLGLFLCVTLIERLWLT